MSFCLYFSLWLRKWWRRWNFGWEFHFSSKRLNQVQFPSFIPLQLPFSLHRLSFWYYQILIWIPIIFWVRCLFERYPFELPPLPLEVNSTLTILNFGTVILKAPFVDSKHIWPIGYKSHVIKHTLLLIPLLIHSFSLFYKNSLFNSLLFLTLSVSDAISISPNRLRKYSSVKNPNELVVYTCEIIDLGDRPMFCVSSSEENVCELF
jgi:hypothetical protein